MTRKQMLKSIELILKNLDGICTSKIIAEMVLDDIERQGMLPPSFQILVETGPYAKPITLNKWED